MSVKNTAKPWQVTWEEGGKEHKRFFHHHEPIPHLRLIRKLREKGLDPIHRGNPNYRYRDKAPRIYPAPTQEELE